MEDQPPTRSPEPKHRRILAPIIKAQAEAIKARNKEEKTRIMAISPDKRSAWDKGILEKLVSVEESEFLEKLLELSAAELAADKTPYDFEAAVRTARANILLEKEVSAAPGHYAIVDTGNRFAVYELCDFQKGGIAGKLVATVNLTGEVTPAATMASAETLEIMANTAALNAIADHKAGRTKFGNLNDIPE